MGYRIVSNGTTGGTFVVDVAAGRQVLGVETVRWWAGKPEGGDHYEAGRLQIGLRHMRDHTPLTAEQVDEFAERYTDAADRHVFSRGDARETDVYVDAERVRGVQFAELKIALNAPDDTYLRYLIRHKKEGDERPPDEWVVWKDRFYLDATIGVDDEDEG